MKTKLILIGVALVIAVALNYTLGPTKVFCLEHDPFGLMYDVCK